MYCIEEGWTTRLELYRIFKDFFFAFPVSLSDVISINLIDHQYRPPIKCMELQSEGYRIGQCKNALSHKQGFKQTMYCFLRVQICFIMLSTYQKILLVKFSLKLSLQTPFQYKKNCFRFFLGLEIGYYICMSKTYLIDKILESRKYQLYTYFTKFISLYSSN